MERLLLYQTSLNTYQNSFKPIPTKVTNRKTTLKKGVKFTQNTHNVVSFEFDDPPSEFMRGFLVLFGVGRMDSFGRFFWGYRRYYRDAHH